MRKYSPLTGNGVPIQYWQINRTWRSHLEYCWDVL